MFCPAFPPARLIVVLLGTALLWQASFDHLGAQETKKETKKAENSDLPAGAVLRIGSSRFLHGGEIRSLAFSPDGKWLASASSEWQSATIRIWEVETGQEVKSLKGHKSPVTRLAFLPSTDAKAPPTLVSGGDDSTIRFWNIKTGEELGQIINHPGPVADFAISPDGKKIASGSTTAKHVFLWETATGKELLRWEAHEHGTARLCFGPEGKTVASAGGSKNAFPGGNGPKDHKDLALWDATKGKLLKQFTGHDFQVTGIALSPDGKVLVAGGPFYQVGSPMWWDTETGKHLKNARSSCYGIALTPDGKTLAVADTSEIHFYDIETAAPQQSLKHPQRPYPKAMAFSHDGSTLASASDDGRILLWDARRRTLKAAEGLLLHAVRGVAVSRDGKAILTMGGDGLLLWDRNSGKMLRTLELPGNRGRGFAVIGHFLPDNRTVAMSPGNAGINFWTWTDGKHQRSVSFDHKGAHLRSLTPDGALFLTGFHGVKDMIVWDALSGKEVRTLPAPQNKGSVFLRAAVLSPNGEHLLAVGLFDHQVYEVDTGKLLYQKTHSGFAPAFSPGGVVTALWSLKFPHSIQLTETATGKEVGDLPLDRRAASHGECVAFSPDGRLVVLVESGLRPGDVGEVKLFEIATGKLLKTLTGHRGKVSMAAFTPDSKALVTGSADCTALVWDLTGVLAQEQKVDVKACWDELALPERRTAYVAFCRLRSVPDEAVPFLKKELTRAAPDAELERLRRTWAIRLLEDLNSASAREVLQDLARNNAEAQDALKRLKRSDSRP